MTRDVEARCYPEGPVRARLSEGATAWSCSVRGAVVWFLLLTSAVDTLTYRDRGGRHEGVLPKPVSGWDVELIGAMVVDPPTDTAATALPDKVDLYFFLEEQKAVYITVRERHAEVYYWLDKVEPKRPWQPMVANLFAWPSEEVLRRLELDLSKLVALARLDRDQPDPVEHVAPVSFHPVPSAAEGRTYRFTFKVNARAKIGFEIRGPAASETSIVTGPIARRDSDFPFDVVWDASGRPEGRYRLLLRGYFLSDNVPIEQEVRFFHASSWPR